MFGGLSHLLHCESIEEDIQLIILDFRSVHLSIEIIALCGWMPFAAFFKTPLHKTLSPTSGGFFLLMLLSGLKLDIHSSTSCVVARLGGGVDGSEGEASPPWKLDELLGC